MPKLNLVPRERRFNELFSRQGQLVSEALAELGGSLNDELSRHAIMRELEHKCDDVTHESRRQRSWNRSTSSRPANQGFSSDSNTLTRLSISSRISLTAGAGRPAGLRMPQSSTGEAKTGHSSASQPIVTTRVAAIAISADSTLGCSLLRSMPTSRITSITSLWTRFAGLVPADSTSTLPSDMRLRNAAAI